MALTITQVRERITAHAQMVADIGNRMTGGVNSDQLAELVRALNYHLLSLRRMVKLLDRP